MTMPLAPWKLGVSAAAAFTALAWPDAAWATTRTVDEHRPAEAAGQVEIQNVAGRVDVVGWDKPEVAVSGTLGSDVERLDIASAGSRTTVRVVMHESHGASFGWHGGGEAQLIVHVPVRSSLTATLVSADISVTGVAGDQELHTVSGAVAASAQRELRINTVSGDVHVTAGPESRRIEVSTVSGDLVVTGGAGDLNVTTVSGDGTLTAGTLSRARIKTVSGDFSIAAALANDGRLEAESVSGDFRITFSGAIPPAVFDLQSFSGELSTCFGRKTSREGPGPGSRLSFQEGAGSARVRVDTKSGNVTLCSKK